MTPDPSIMRALPFALLLFSVSACSSPERVTVQAPVATVTNETVLDSNTIDKFLGALVRLNQIELPEGTEFAFEPRVFDGEGRYSPFSSNLGILNGLEQQHQARRIIDAAGLGTVEEFASIGDRIYRAYAAVSLEEESKAGSPAGQDLMKVAQTVPEEDRQAVRGYFERLSKVLEG
jgi:hypothetical protein